MRIRRAAGGAGGGSRARALTDGRVTGRKAAMRPVALLWWLSSASVLFCDRTAATPLNILMLASDDMRPEIADPYLNIRCFGFSLGHCVAGISFESGFHFYLYC